MNVYVFDTPGMRASDEAQREIERVLARIAEGTPTSDLVVGVYLTRGKDWYAHTSVEWVLRERFGRGGGRWNFLRRHLTPTDLPERFKLIRVAIGRAISYPATMHDSYGWCVRCERFADHLAYVFAHELHHFRRHHLDLHPREGEQAACRWGLKRAEEAGFAIEGSRKDTGARSRRKKRVLLPEERRPGLLKEVLTSASQLCLEDLRELARWTQGRIRGAGHRLTKSKWDDHFDALRALPPGAPVLIVGDDEQKRYLGQTAAKIRSLRGSSPRLAVRTNDGKEWHWPMEWLSAQAPPERDRGGTQT